MNVGIILAAGQGKRMNIDKAKQFLEIDGKLLVCYALDTFEKSSIIDEVILVTGQDDIPFVKNEVVEKYHYNKVKSVVAGGKERYDSVLKGLMAIEDADYVFIHDGARPLIGEEVLLELCEEVKSCGACVPGVQVKDTIKVADEEGFSLSTPNRNLLWAIQTPQVFSYKDIRDAYLKMMESPHDDVTDDAMVMERYGERAVKIVASDYRNIKITSPEDLIIMKAYMQ